MKGRSLFTVIALLLVTTVSATQPLVAELVADRFKETVRAEAPVAGEDILGVVIGSASLAADARSLFIRMPSHPVPSICVTVESRDGRYLAYDNSYRIPISEGPGFIEIPIVQAKPLGTQHQEYYSTASAQDLAVLAREGPCALRGSKVLPTFWGRNPSLDPDLTLTFAIQSGRSTIRMTTPGVSRTVPRCVVIKDGQRTAFDTLCEIHVPHSYAGSLSIHLQRCSFDDCADQPEQEVEL